MNLYRKPVRNKIALGLAILDGVLVVLTLVRHADVFRAAFDAPFTQLLAQSTWWSGMAEVLFYCTTMVTLYGLISLWMPDLRIVLWAGLSLVVIAGLLYLLSALLFFRSDGMGAPVQQGLFMFVISILFPLLLIKLLRRQKRTRAAKYYS
jgi:hypothetical protein